jgi:hypothetical protein
VSINQLLEFIDEIEKTMQSWNKGVNYER